MINIINAKMSIDGNGLISTGGARGKQTSKLKEPQSLFRQVTTSDLALTFNRERAMLKVIKDRTGLIDKPVKIEYAIDQFSSIISRIIFGDNDLIMFEEGLCGEIKNAIEETIEKYHTKRR